MTTKKPEQADDRWEGFVNIEIKMATIEKTAELFEVTPRTIRNWISEREDFPLPAHRREGQAPVFYIPAVLLWVIKRRLQNPDFGRHGGWR